MLLLSIHPKYVDAILLGEKSIELRRRKPRIKSGPMLIYASSPRMELAAEAWVESVTQAPLNLLWQAVRYEASVSRNEFDAYFNGLELGTALHLKRVRPLADTISLERLRELWQGFHPPQGFRYLREAELEAIGMTSQAKRVA